MNNLGGASRINIVANDNKETDKQPDFRIVDSRGQELGGGWFIKLDKYRKLACFEEGRILGYIRWRANEYGTQDWRFYILKTQGAGILTRVAGVSPAVKLLAFFNGPQLVRRALKAFDRVEAETAGGLNSLSESYWMTFQNDLGARHNMAAHRRDDLILEASHVG